MKLMRGLICLALIMTMAQGCVFGRGRIGNPITEEQVVAIQKGITTKSLVVTLLGAPDRIVVGPEREIFHYYYYDGKSPALFLGIINFVGFDLKNDNLYVFFDKSDVAQDLVYGNRTQEVSFWHWPWGK